SFFCSRLRAPCALPSFPTRRSSDLSTRVASSSIVGACAPYISRNACSSPATSRRDHSRSGDLSGALIPFPAACPMGGIWRRQVRSEEHTSELQSLTNLVCRLLLEKK